MNNEADFDQWRADWRAAAPETMATVGAVQRAHRRYRALAVAEYLAAALLLAGAVGYAALGGDTRMWAWAATVWAITIPTLIGVVRMRRGLWQATDASVRGFLQLEIRRHRYRLRSTRFGLRVLVVTVAANAVWALYIARTAPDAAIRVALVTVALAAVVILVLLLFARQARRGLAGLEALARGLDEAP
jgi:hypothetical protein